MKKESRDLVASTGHLWSKHWTFVWLEGHLASFNNLFLIDSCLVLCKGRQLKLTKEYFYQVKPGLSAYASDPKQVSKKCR